MGIGYQTHKKVGKTNKKKQWSARGMESSLGPKLIESQIVNWKYRLPELADYESQERIVTAAEVQEELDDFKDVVDKRLKEVLTGLNSTSRKCSLD